MPDFSILTDAFAVDTVIGALLGVGLSILGLVLVVHGIRKVRYVVWLASMERAGSGWGEARKARARHRGF